MKKGIRTAMCAALIAGCFSAGVFAENVKLTYMYLGSPTEDDATKKALKDFEAATPGITVAPSFHPEPRPNSTRNSRPCLNPTLSPTSVISAPKASINMPATTSSST